MTTCGCGCGGLTSLAKDSCAKRGYVKGKPKSFIAGHNARSKNPGHTVDTETGCWLWNGYLTKRGYPGMTSFGGTIQAAHRSNYMRVKGPIPKGQDLDHLCRTPRCVNPDHLEAVSRAENCRRSSATKLSKSDVAHIMALLIAGRPKTEIARKFGVSDSLICLINSGARWSA